MRFGKKTGVLSAKSTSSHILRNAATKIQAFCNQPNKNGIR